MGLCASTQPYGTQEVSDVYLSGAIFTKLLRFLRVFL